MTDSLELSYAEAMGELAEILQLLDNPEIDVDQLASRVARGKQLVDHCRERLTSAELAVNEVLGDDDE